MNRCRFSTLLLSDTGEGKTTQIGMMALWWFKKTGGYIDPKTEQAVGGERTVLYAGDFGGWSVVQALIDLGIIYLVDLTQLADDHGKVHPFDWLDKISSCKVPLVTAVGTQWVTSIKNGGKFGHFAFDSGTTISHLLMENLRQRTTEGENIGGTASYKFEDNGYKVASNNQTHYNIAQTTLLKAIAKSQVSTTGLITWTFRLRRADADAGGQVIGPAAAGGALTPELPGWFTYAFRLAKLVQVNQPPRVVLYFDHHIDPANPSAKVLANGRVPLGADPPEPQQDPANVPKMLDHLLGAADQSKSKIIAACPPPTQSAVEKNAADL